MGAGQELALSILDSSNRFFLAAPFLALGQTGF